MHTLHHSHGHNHHNDNKMTDCKQWKGGGTERRKILTCVYVCMHACMYVCMQAYIHVITVTTTTSMHDNNKTDGKHWARVFSSSHSGHKCSKHRESFLQRGLVLRVEPANARNRIEVTWARMISLESAECHKGSSELTSHQHGSLPVLWIKMTRLHIWFLIPNEAVSFEGTSSSWPQHIGSKTDEAERGKSYLREESAQSYPFKEE